MSFRFKIFFCVYLIVLSSSIPNTLLIAVDDPTDTITDPNLCIGNLANSCNIRSAVARCTEQANSASVDICKIEIPVGIFYISCDDSSIGSDNSPLGSINIHRHDVALSSMWNISISGQGKDLSTIACSADPPMGNARFMSVTGDDSKLVTLSVSQLTFSYFGLFSSQSGYDGGTISITNTNGSIFSDVRFLGVDSWSLANGGNNGGALSSSHTSYTTIFNCEFLSPFSYDSGGAIYIEYSDHISIDNSYFNGLFPGDGMSGNAYGGNGGAIFMTGVVHSTVSRCVFEHTSAYIANDIPTDLFVTDTSGRGFGGGMYLHTDNIDILVTYCVFRQTSAASGGAIFIHSLNHRIHVRYCVFTGNKVDNMLGNAGEKGFKTTGGAAIYVFDSNEDLVVSDCSFHKNTLLPSYDPGVIFSDGGAIYFRQYNTNTKISRCNFTENAASGRAGAVYLHLQNTDMHISDCVFVGNSVPLGAGSDTGQGGSLYVYQRNDGLVLSHCIFTHHYTVSAGAALCVVSFNRGIRILDSQFVSNSAYLGGAIYMGDSNDDFAVRRSVFANNHAIMGGGAILFNDQGNGAEFSSVVFTGNSVVNTGGSGVGGVGGGAIAIWKLFDNLLINNCTFSNHTSSALGAVLYLGFGCNVINIMNSRFIDNTAVYGGCVFITEFVYFMHILNTVFEDNIAVGGAALYFNLNNKHIILERCNFNFNFASSQGGALVLHSGNDFLYVINSTFTNNTATGEGGAVLLVEDNTLVYFIASYFRANVARTGGAITLLSYNSIGNNSMSAGLVSSSEGSGNGNDNDNDNNGIDRCIFILNRAYSSGGAIFGKQSNKLLVRNSLFLLNSVATATNTATSTATTGGGGGAGGGAISLLSNNAFLLLKCNFSRNTVVVSNGDGGAVFVDTTPVSVRTGQHSSSSSSSVVAECSFFHNSVSTYNGGSGGGGGAIAMGGGTGISSSGGGGRSSTSGSDTGLRLGGLVVRDSSFESNEAAIGGALRLQHTLQSTISRCSFSYNSATTVGGAVSVDTTNGTSLASCSFVSNNAVHGSAVYASTSPEMSFSGSVFRGNRAVLGGTVFWEPDGSASGAGSAMTEPRGLSSPSSSSSSSTSSMTFSDITYPVLLPLSPLSPNRWIDNVAPYGNRYATAATQLTSSISRTVTSYRGGDTLPPFTLYTTDYYGQIVTVENGSYISSHPSSNCSQLGFLSGQEIATTTRGAATFAGLQAHCEPNGIMDVTFKGKAQAQSSKDYLSTTVRVSFRACVRGEYYGGGQCLTCGNGSYSVRDTSSVNSISTTSSPSSQEPQCLDCPSTADYCYGDVISLKPGYWRVNAYADHIFPCINGDTACKGGSGVGVDLCASGYTGPLCGVCEVGYTWTPLGSECRRCTSSNGSGSGYSPMLVMLIFVTIALGLWIIFSTLGLDGMSQRFYLHHQHQYHHHHQQQQEEEGELDPGVLHSHSPVSLHQYQHQHQSHDHESSNNNVSNNNNNSNSPTAMAAVRRQLDSDHTHHDGLEMGTAPGTGVMSVSGRPARLMVHKESTVSSCHPRDSIVEQPPPPDTPLVAFGRTLRRIQQRLPVKTLLGCYQLVAMFPFTLFLRFPYPFRTLLAFLGWVNINFFEHLGLSCEYNYDNVGALIVATALPMLLSVLILCVALIHDVIITSNVSRIASVLEKERRETRGKYFTLFLWLTYYSLPGACSLIFRSFSCVDTNPEDTYAHRTDMFVADTFMRMDMSVECGSYRQRLAVGWAAGMILVYPVGILVLYLALRDDMSLEETTTTGTANTTGSPGSPGSPTSPGSQGSRLMVGRGGGSEHQGHNNNNNLDLLHLQTEALALRHSIGFLYDEYTAKLWYWEVRIGGDYASDHSHRTDLFAPYRKRDDAIVADLSQYAVFFTLFGALLIRARVLDEFPTAATAIGALLLIACCAPLIVALAQIATPPVLAKAAASHYHFGEALELVMETTEAGRHLEHRKTEVLTALRRIARDRRKEGLGPLSPEELNPLLIAAGCASTDASMLDLLECIRHAVEERSARGLAVHLTPADLRPVILASARDLSPVECKQLSSAMKIITMDRELNGLPPLAAVSVLGPTLLINLSSLAASDGNGDRDGDGEGIPFGSMQLSSRSSKSSFFGNISTSDMSFSPDDYENGRGQGDGDGDEKEDGGSGDGDGDGMGESTFPTDMMTPLTGGGGGGISRNGNRHRTMRPTYSVAFRD
eukprot:gene2605-5095_t